MKYFSWDKKMTADFTDAAVNKLYDQGYVFTRVAKGAMNQTRSVRVDLSKFESSSENKRVLRKASSLQLIAYSLPLENYHWSIAKMAKDFYTEKFGPKTFSVNKLRTLMTDAEKSNFNLLLEYKPPGPPVGGNATGYCIAVETNELLHYSYPFYAPPIPDKGEGVGGSGFGMAMMLKAILHAQENGKKYFYIGSATRPGDKYKLQFKGLEWFDSKEWQTDLKALKEILKKL